MADEDQMAKSKKPLTFAGLTALAQALDSKQAHTSFGKLPLSVEKTSECYSFPAAKLSDGKKVYLGELTKIENTGKNSPATLYMYDDKIKYQDAPKYQFSQAPRCPPEKPKYDFYENALFLDDPINADLARKKRCTAPKIGTEPRMQINNMEANPGPQYYPKEKPEYKAAPNYTFGYKRGANALKNQTSTPASVGPGRYAPEHAVQPSTKRDQPRWTLPKAGRPDQAFKKYDHHQTYYTKSSFGNQGNSKKSSSQVCHFGSSGRENSNRLGTFKDQMQGGASVKMYHPKY